MTLEETLAALVGEITELRAAFAQQQEEISALRAEMNQRRSSDRLTAQTHAAAHSEADAAIEAEQRTAPRKGTSRRGLLRGAAAATAAATVATVALGAAQEAHAAPAASGGNFILGQPNDAAATTALTNSSGSRPGSVLQVTTTVSGSSGFAAITGSSTSASAVQGIDNGSGGYGVIGTASGQGGTGVWGIANNGLGILGEGANGVQGKGNGGYDLAATGTGRMFQLQQPQVGAPSYAGQPGEFIRDNIGNLWLCITNNGTASDWMRVAHLVPGSNSGGAVTYLSKPIRLLDTRQGATDALYVPGTPCTSQTPTTVKVGFASYNGVTLPVVMAGVMGNVTVVNAAGGGYIELVPTGAGFTGAANLAYTKGQVVSNFFNVGLPSDHASWGLVGGQSFDIIIGGASTDVIIDVFAIVA